MQYNKRTGKKKLKTISQRKKRLAKIKKRKK